MYANKQEDQRQKIAMAARMAAVKFFAHTSRADIAKINMATFKIKFPDYLSRRDQDYVEAVSTEVKIYIARIQAECAQAIPVEEKMASPPLLNSPTLHQRARSRSVPNISSPSARPNGPDLQCLSPSYVGPASPPALLTVHLPCAMPLNAPSHRLMNTLVTPVLNEGSGVLGMAFKFPQTSTTVLP